MQCIIWKELIGDLELEYCFEVAMFNTAARHCKFCGK